MNVLGMDTATAATAVALTLADGGARELRDDPPPGAHPGHATRLLTMAGELVEDAGIDWQAIDRVAVGVGPGTFTGLRVGVATARALAQSLAAQLVGVGSLDALATAALGEHGGVIAVIDARRGEVFAAPYRAGADGSPQRLARSRALPPRDVGELAAGLRADGSGPVAVGDGARRYRAELEAAGLLVPPDPSPLHRVAARAVCALGARVPGAQELLDVVPDYHRRPDAELAFEDAGVDAARRG